MIRKWYIVIVLFCCLACIGASPLEALRQAEELKLSADEIVATQNGAGDIVAQGNVRLEYGILTVTAEKVSLNRETLDFAANGNVVAELSDGTGRWEAPAISGNMKTHEMKFGPYRADGEIWHIGGEDAAYDAEGIANVQRGWVTTCDKKEPHYRLQSKQITIKPDKTFTAKHVTLHVGNVPIFYFPYLWGDFQGMDNIIFKPGYSGKRGFYLRLGRIWRTAKHTENGDGQISLYGDLMTKRGIGLGSDAAYESRDKQRQASSTLYYLHDWDTPETAHGWNRRFKSTDDRFRIHGYFRETWDGDWGPFERATFRANLDYLSDIDMLEDWFRRIHRRQQQPRSFLDFALEGEVVSAGIDLRPRINDFYTVAQTLPELRLDVARTELFPQLPLQYQSSTRAGYYSMKWRDFDRSRKDLLPDDIWYDSELYRDNSDYEAFRAHTQHFLYVPTELSDWSILTPRAGFALTYYNRSSKQPITQKDIADMIDLDNPEKTRSKTIVKEYDSKGGDVTRFAFETGAEWRGAFYSDWFDCKNEILQLTSIRHVVEPYLNYTYMHNPSHDRDHLYYFDDIDRLEKQHFLRFGLDQRLLARQDNTSRTFLRWQAYFDLHACRDAENRRRAGNLGNRLDFTLRDDLSLWGTLVHDVGEGNLHRGEFGVRFGKTEEPNFRLRYIYRNDHLSRSTYSLGGNLVDLTGEDGYTKKYFESADIVRGEVTIPLNSLTELNISAEYDFEKGKLSEHMYEIRRDLHCWKAALAFGWDNDSFEVGILLQLTAFPNVKIDLNL